MKYLKKLNRTEMKNISGGIIVIDGCQYPGNGCTGVASYYNCQSANCNAWYGGSAAAMSCANLVNQQHANRIGSCGSSYS